MFEIQLKQKDLMYALKAAKSTVGTNSNNNGDDCISITDVGDGSVELYTTNGIEFTRILLTPSSNLSNGATMPYVNFNRFFAIISSISESEYVSIKGTLTGIEIQVGQSKPIKLTGSSNGFVGLPSMPQGISNVSSEHVISLSSSDFKQIIESASAIITDSKSNTMKDCICIDVKSGYNTFEVLSCDTTNQRVYYREVNNEIVSSIDASIFINAAKMKKVKGLFELYRSVDIYKIGNLIMLKGENTYAYYNNPDLLGVEYYIRNINGTFPQNVSDQFVTTDKVVFPAEEFKSSLIRAISIEESSNTATKSFQFNVKDDKVSIHQTTQYGTIEDEIPMSVSNKNLNITENFNTHAMLELVNLVHAKDDNWYHTNIIIGKNQKNGYVIYKENHEDNTYLITGVSTSSTATTP